jgi:hypothetical protein
MLVVYIANLAGVRPGFTEEKQGSRKAVHTATATQHITLNFTLLFQLV